MRQDGFYDYAVDYADIPIARYDGCHALCYQLGNLGALWVCFAFYFYFIKKDRQTAAFLLLAIALTWSLNDLVIKQLVDRPRPFMTHAELPALIAMPTSSSFPSGHTATSFAAMMILYAVGGPYKWMGLKRRILIAFSRIYLHVHYPSDVLAGCLVGLCVGALLVRLMKQRDEKLAPRPREKC